MTRAIAVLLAYEPTYARTIRYDAGSDCTCAQRKRSSSDFYNNNRCELRAVQLSLAAWLVNLMGDGEWRNPYVSLVDSQGIVGFRMQMDLGGMWKGH